MLLGGRHHLGGPAVRLLDQPYGLGLGLLDALARRGQQLLALLAGPLALLVGLLRGRNRGSPRPRGDAGRPPPGRRPASPTPPSPVARRRPAPPPVPGRRCPAPRSSAARPRPPPRSAAVRRWTRPPRGTRTRPPRPRRAAARSPRRPAPGGVRMRSAASERSRSASSVASRRIRSASARASVSACSAAVSRSSASVVQPGQLGGGLVAARPYRPLGLLAQLARGLLGVRLDAPRPARRPPRGAARPPCGCAPGSPRPAGAASSRARWPPSGPARCPRWRGLAQLVRVGLRLGEQLLGGPGRLLDLLDGLAARLAADPLALGDRVGAQLLGLAAQPAGLLLELDGLGAVLLGVVLRRALELRRRCRAPRRAAGPPRPRPRRGSARPPRWPPGWSTSRPRTPCSGRPRRCGPPSRAGRRSPRR